MNLSVLFDIVLYPFRNIYFFIVPFCCLFLSGVIWLIFRLMRK